MTIQCDPAALREQADGVRRLLDSRLAVPVGQVGVDAVWIQASYDPVTRVAVIDIDGLHDGLLLEEP